MTENAYFSRASIIIPVMDEKGVADVVSRLRSVCSVNDLEEILLVCPKNVDPSYWSFLEQVCTDAADVHGRRLIQHGQGVGDAIFSGFCTAQGSHVIVLGADMENDPDTVPLLIETSKQRPDMIVTASRRIEKNGLKNYPVFKKQINRFLQWFLRQLFSSSQTDITYVFQSTPISAFRRAHFMEDHAAFVLELALLPERYGIPFTEIPSAVGKREEGRSHLGIKYYLHWLSAILKLFFGKVSDQT